MSKNVRYELVAIFGPDHCPNCGTELITRARFTEISLSLDKPAALFQQSLPWTDILFSDSELFFPLMQMSSFQLGHQPIANSEKMLIRAMIRCALSDARGENSVTRKRDVYSAHRVLSSDLFVERCDWLGTPPKIRCQAVLNAIEGRQKNKEIIHDHQRTAYY
jgi:hypothetical protein